MFILLKKGPKILFASLEIQVCAPLCPRDNSFFYPKIVFKQLCRTLTNSICSAIHYG